MMMVMREVVSELQLVRRRARVLLIVQRMCLILAGLLAVVVAMGVTDFLVHLPAPARFLETVLLLGGLGVAVWRYIRPALAFQPGLTAVALRLERVLPALEGRLATGVEFSLAGVDLGSGMAARAVADARRRAGRENLRTLIKPARTLRDLGVAVAALAAIASIWLAFPAHAGIAASRLFMPLGAATWPKVTLVESALGADVFPRGRALPLRARVLKGRTDDMRVFAHYRLISAGGETGLWEQVVLTHQHGDLFERLIEPDADRIEVWFETVDDRTATQDIRLVPPPAIVEARLEITPPPYARGHVAPIDANLGPGTDSRAVSHDPVLHGSEARLTLSFNKPIPVPGVSLSSDSRDEPETTATDWAAVLGWEAGAATPLGSAPGARDQQSESWLIQWRIADVTRVHPTLVDEFGLLGPDDIRYRIDAVPDHVPSVSMTDPVADQTVLPTAVIPVAAEGRDDVRLGELWINATRNRPAKTFDVDAGGVVPGDPPGDSFASPSQYEADPPVTLVRTTGRGAVERTSAELSLSDLAVEPGDLVRLAAGATDTFALDGRVHEPATSAIRTLRVISRSEFVERVLHDLASVRDGAIRLEDEQRRLGEEISSSLISSGNRREQARIGQRIARQSDAIDEIGARLERNRLGERELTDLIEQARDLLDHAGQASNQAAEAMAEAQKLEAETDEQAAEQRAAVDEAVGNVVDELTDLISLLDRGHDSWVMRNRIQRLLQVQRDLAEATRSATDRLRGRERDELADAERSRLDDLSGRQSEIAAQAHDLARELRDRAQDIEDAEPELADAMREAADRAEQQQLEGQMNEASQRIEANQGQRAAQSQQSAMQIMQNMLDDIEQSEKARVERLQRQLDSLVEALNSLITGQENQIVALQRARDTQQFQGLDVGMIQLNRNTYAVQEQASAAGRELQSVAGLIDQAASAQGAAVTALRAAPIADGDAYSAEQRSLDRLTEARDEARKIQEQLQQQADQEKKQELIRSYRELFEREERLRAQTEPLVGLERLNRRQRVAARQLGNEQARIQGEAAQLVEQTAELADALVFRATHRGIDITAQQVIESLRRGEVGPGVLMRQQDIADLLLALARALQDDPDESEFQDPNASSGGGGGGGGGGQAPPLIPPIAQLKLLRGMQDSIYRATRTIDEATGLPEGFKGQRSDELGIRQADLARMAQQLITEMQRQQQRGGEGGPPTRPTQPPDPAPDPVPDPSPETGSDPGGDSPADPDRPSAFSSSHESGLASNGNEQWMSAFTSAIHAASPMSIPEYLISAPPTTDEGEKEEPPTLDELLGLDEDEQEETGDSQLPDIRDELNEPESPGQAGVEQLFLEATRSMEQSAARLSDRHDPGLVTQRLQEEALLKLDMLIKQAGQSRRSGASGSASRQQNQGRQPPPGQGDSSANRSAGGDNMGADNRPLRREGNLDDRAFAETRREWGDLPERVRDLLLQGRDDIASPLYRHLTELYYRRLAEEEADK